MGKKGVPVRMNSEKKKKKKNPSRVAIKTTSRQIKWQKKVTSWNLNCYCYWLPSSTSKREEHFEISTTQTYTVKFRK